MNDLFFRFDWRENRLFIFGLILCAYFTYHLIYGPRSLPYLQQVQAQNIVLTEELNTLDDKQSALENKVVKLRPETLDHDLLKERARTMLGYTQENEIIVIDER